MRPDYHPHPRHFYEDKAGVTHLCNAAQIVPSDIDTYIVWTLCEKMDVPADKSFISHVVCLLTLFIRKGLAKQLKCRCSERLHTAMPIVTMHVNGLHFLAK